MPSGAGLRLFVANALVRLQWLGHIPSRHGVPACPPVDPALLRLRHDSRVRAAPRRGPPLARRRSRSTRPTSVAGSGTHRRSRHRGRPRRHRLEADLRHLPRTERSRRRAARPDGAGSGSHPQRMAGDGSGRPNCRGDPPRERPHACTTRPASIRRGRARSSNPVARLHVTYGKRITCVAHCADHAPSARRKLVCVEVPCGSPDTLVFSVTRLSYLSFLLIVHVKAPQHLSILSPRDN